jgi:hypothetical protein
MGGSPLRRKLLAFLARYALSPAFAGSKTSWFDPGAYAPGFMLAPAPQAKADLSCKAADDRTTVRAATECGPYS